MPSSKKKKSETTSGSGSGVKTDANGVIKAELSEDVTILNRGFLVIICLGLWVFHFQYLNFLFENDRHFSHLADFEREMTYRTEMGLYYSYYKTLIEAESFTEGMHSIMNDNVSEYGHTINTLQRFNLYPEVILAPLYRMFSSFTKSYKFKTQDCYWINRGQELEPVESCEGIGNPHYFYIYGAFFFAGATLPMVYILGFFLGNGHIGGAMSVVAYMFNHGEATRAMWTPPLRETFAYPVFLAQTAVITCVLKYKATKTTFYLLIFLNVLFMLFWQFAQFALLTQALAVFLVHVLEYSSSNTLRSIVRSYTAAFIIASGLLFFNKMLLVSLYFNVIIGLNVLITMRPIFNQLRNRLLYIGLNVFTFLSSTLAIKLIIRNYIDVKDDAHIFDILKAKFSDYANFHTQLYTCAAEFDFLPAEYFQKLSWTALIPCAALSIVFILYMLVKWECRWSAIWSRNVSSPNQGKPFAELVFHLFQLAACAIMAGMIMRLKLFLTPELCVVAAVFLNKQFLQLVMHFRPHKYRIPLAIAIFSLMAYKGHDNIRSQLKIHGEYSNPEQEQLFAWIQKKTPTTAVFAGSMPLMANLKLSTSRPIVNHPHYEDDEIRKRTMQVYSMYSRRSLNEVHDTLQSMGVNYFIFQPQSCYAKHPKPNCTYLEMWDLTEPARKKDESLCSIFAAALNPNKPSHNLLNPFKVVHKSDNYVVLKL